MTSTASSIRSLGSRLRGGRQRETLSAAAFSLRRGRRRDALAVERANASDLKRSEWRTPGAVLTLTASYSRTCDFVCVVDIARVARLDERRVRSSLKRLAELTVIVWQPGRGRSVPSLLGLPEIGKGGLAGARLSGGEKLSTGEPVSATSKNRHTGDRHPRSTTEKTNRVVVEAGSKTTEEDPARFGDGDGLEHISEALRGFTPRGECKGCHEPGLVIADVELWLRSSCLAEVPA